MSIHNLFNNIMNISLSKLYLNKSFEDDLYLLGYNSIAVIDSEGIVVKTGGSKRSKITTFLIRKISISIYCIETCEIFNYSTLIRLPDLDKFNTELRYRIVKQWRYTERIHGLEYDCNNGLDINVAIEIILNNTREYNSYLENGKCLILAKGSNLETRLLNKLGLQGDSVIMRTVNREELKYNIFDITDINAPKFDILFKNKKIHDPVTETEFYLRYSLLHICKIICKLKI